MLSERHARGEPVAGTCYATYARGNRFAVGCDDYTVHTSYTSTVNSDRAKSAKGETLRKSDRLTIYFHRLLLLQSSTYTRFLCTNVQLPVHRTKTLCGPLSSEFSVIG